MGWELNLLAKTYQLITIIWGLVVIGHAYRHRQIQAQAIIARGLLAMEILTLGMRLWQQVGLAKGLNLELSLVMNTAYLVPTIYMIAALAWSERTRRVSEWEIRLADMLHEHQGKCSECIRGRNCPNCLRLSALAAGYFYEEGLREWRPRIGVQLVRRLVQFFSFLLAVAG